MSKQKTSEPKFQFFRQDSGHYNPRDTDNLYKNVQHYDDGAGDRIMVEPIDRYVGKPLEASDKLVQPNSLRKFQSANSLKGK